MQPSKLPRIATLVFALLVTAACGSDGPIAQITNKITCHDVCQRYADCYDNNYDVSACTDKCTNDATAENEKEDKLKACDDCIGEKSCLSATFNCATDCGSFVP